MTTKRRNLRVFAFSVWAFVVSMGSASGVALAQDDAGGVVGIAEVPTTGAARLGPVAADASPAGEPGGRADAESEVTGVAPIAIQIEKAGVDAPIERTRIVDGEMQNPTGPWVVSWYQDLSALGEDNNVVMAGHLDYWSVGEAVFWRLPELVEGDVIRVIAEDGETFEYAVERNELYDVATDLTPEVIEEAVVGETGEETLTLITCGGPFNRETGEYLERRVVRAVQTA